MSEERDLGMSYGEIDAEAAFPRDPSERICVFPCEGTGLTIAATGPPSQPHTRGSQVICPGCPDCGKQVTANRDWLSQRVSKK
jgi:hypothetical protein